MRTNCSGDHDIYVAEVSAFETLGRLVVVTVCRGCDMVNFHEYNVGQAGTIRLKSQEKENANAVSR